MHFALPDELQHLHTRRLGPQLVNWQLIFAGEEEVAQWADGLGKFQAHFEVLHRLRLNPWACASWPLVNHSASSLPPWFSYPSVSVDFVLVNVLFSGRH